MLALQMGQSELTSCIISSNKFISLPTLFLLATNVSVRTLGERKQDQELVRGIILLRLTTGKACLEGVSSLLSLLFANMATNAD
jgi:hypothetical protein